MPEIATLRPDPMTLAPMTLAPMTLANAHLILPEAEIRGQITVQDGEIVAISEGGAVPKGAMDCIGDIVAPGLIELHTDNLERHIRPRPAVHWPHGAAIVAHDAELASCGITTVFDAIRVGSVEGKGGTGWARYARELADEVLAFRTQGALKISHHLHLRAEVCSHSLIEELAQFGADDRVGIVSIMDHTPGQRQFADLDQYKVYMRGKHGLSHEDFEDHVSTRQALGVQMRDAHEAAAVKAAGRLGAVLASHDDSTLNDVARSASHGIALAEFPTTLSAAQACHDRAIAVMMGAPNLIRGASHSGNVAAGDLAEAGLLDILSSDYVPSALLYSAVRLSEIWGDMARAMATVTSAPARATGLTDRGVLALGKRADLIRFRPLNGVPVLQGVWSAGIRVA